MSECFSNFIYIFLLRLISSHPRGWGIFILRFDQQLSTMVGRRKFFLKKHWLKRPKITNFTGQFRSKNLTHFMNLNSLDIENNMQPKTSLTLQVFQQTCSCLMSEKTFALHHFLTLQNCILEALWKQMSVYFCISLQEKFCSEDVVRFNLVGGGLGGSWIISLRWVAA